METDATTRWLEPQQYNFYICTHQSSGLLFQSVSLLSLISLHSLPGSVLYLNISFFTSTHHSIHLLHSYPYSLFSPSCTISISLPSSFILFSRIKSAGYHSGRCEDIPCVCLHMWESLKTKQKNAVYTAAVIFSCCTPPAVGDIHHMTSNDTYSVMWLHKNSAVVLVPSHQTTSSALNSL